MFVLPRNESDANKIQKVASMICEAFYREKILYKINPNVYRLYRDGKPENECVTFTKNQKDEVVESYLITQDALNSAFEIIENAGYHMIKRTRYVASGLNWAYEMRTELLPRHYESPNIHIIF